MDVYIGFGLLSAGVVVLVFMLIDSWFKGRSKQRMATRSSANLSDSNHHQPMDEADFLLGAEDEIIAVRSYNRSSDVSTLDNMPNFASQNSEEWVEAGVAPVMKSTVTMQPKKIADVAPEKQMRTPPNLLVMSVMARLGTHFESYDLLQALSSAGLQFGEMNIFHYYQTTATGNKITLFSLASATKPGEFDMDNIAEMSCPGLMLFMDIGQIPDPQYAFKIMLDTAERLAEDLDGSLRADPLTPWSEKLAWQYHQKIMQYKAAARHERTTYA